MQLFIKLNVAEDEVMSYEGKFFMIKMSAHDDGGTFDAFFRKFTI